MQFTLNLFNMDKNSSVVYVCPCTVGNFVRLIVGAECDSSENTPDGAHRITNAMDVNIYSDKSLKIYNILAHDPNLLSVAPLQSFSRVHAIVMRNSDYFTSSMFNSTAVVLY